MANQEEVETYMGILSKKEMRCATVMRLNG